MWFSTVAPAYLDKTNAATLHAALRLGRGAAAYDVGRLGALRPRRTPRRARQRGCEPGRDRRHARSDCPAVPTRRPAATARPRLLVGDDTDGPVLAEFVTWQSTTEEFLDRWRTPGDVAVEGVGGAVRRDPLHEPGCRGVGSRAEGCRPRGRPDRPSRGHEHPRAGGRCGHEEARRRGGPRRRRARRRRGQHRCRAPGAAVVPRARTARPGPDDRAASCSPTAPTRSSCAPPPALAEHAPLAPLEQQVAAAHRSRTASTSRGAACCRSNRRGGPNRRVLRRRPPAVAIDWKFGFVGSDGDDGAVHLPPSRARRQRAPDGGSDRNHRHVHHRQARVLAESARRVRGRRLRRRRPGADRAHRCRIPARSRSVDASR